MLGKGKCHLPMNLKDEGKRGIELINQMYEGLFCTIYARVSSLRVISSVMCSAPFMFCRLDDV